MKLPITWLKDYVDFNIDAKTLADDLTLSGTKVEGLVNPFDVIQNVYTSKIVSIESHPEADKLVVCQVDINKEEPIQIVTAATNMKEGDLVPVALHGSTLWGGLSIKKGKLRGVVSNGMFCSEEELGLKEEGTCDGLMILPRDMEVGLEIKEALGLNGGILDLEITSNRPDCLSILGLAREVSAFYQKPLNKPMTSYTSVKSEIAPVKVSLDSSLVNRYIAREITNVTIKESEEWIKSRLLEAGIRPINNMVDLTNFVMLEIGQPLHAFDRREITSGIIRVAESNKGDQFTTLDGIERTLEEKTLLIKDGENTIGIAGIMGGLDSEIKEDTTNVILESANFDGVTTRRAASSLNLRTEASVRFDKDIDPNLCVFAMDRICHLIEKLNIGTVLDYEVDVYPNIREENRLDVRASYINTFLGTSLDADYMADILRALEIKTEVDGDTLHLETPTFRNDLFIKEDITEEIARIHGYNKIEATLPSVNALRSGLYPHQKVRRKLVEYLTAQGLFESITYSFVSEKDLDKIEIAKDSPLRQMVKIRNPLGEDFSFMRTTLVSSMMDSLSRNEAKSNEEAALFEMGNVYLPTEDALPIENEKLVIGLYGKDLFYKLKGIVEIIRDEFFLEKVTFKRSDEPYFHPGKAAEVMLGKKTFACFGEIHPSVQKNYDMEKTAYILEMDLNILFDEAVLDRKYAGIAKYPSVTRDIAVVLDESILVQEIEKVFESKGGPILESYSLFDVYQGAQLPEGKKSVAYNLVYRHKDKTLTDKEVGKVHEKIVRTIEHVLGGVLRTS